MANIKLGAINLNKKLVEDITGDEQYYYQNCRIVLRKGEIMQILQNNKVVWLEKIKDQINENFLKDANIELVREGNYNTPGMYEIFFKEALRKDITLL